MGTVHSELTFEDEKKVLDLYREGMSVKDITIEMGWQPKPMYFQEIKQIILDANRDEQRIEKRPLAQEKIDSILATATRQRRHPLTDQDIEQIRKEYIAGATYSDLQRRHKVPKAKLQVITQGIHAIRSSNAQRTLKAPLRENSLENRAEAVFQLFYGSAWHPKRIASAFSIRVPSVMALLNHGENRRGMKATKEEDLDKHTFDSGEALPNFYDYNNLYESDVDDSRNYAPR